MGQGWVLQHADGQADEVAEQMPLNHTLLVVLTVPVLCQKSTLQNKPDLDAFTVATCNDLVISRISYTFVAMWHRCQWILHSS